MKNKFKPDIFQTGVLFLIAIGLGLMIAAVLPNSGMRNMPVLVFTMGALAFALGILEISRKRTREKKQHSTNRSSHSQH